MEALLRRDVRAALPMARQIVLYLDPSAFFKDASRGPLHARRQALHYNCARRGLLIAYLRRWMAIAAFLLLGMAIFETVVAERSLSAVPAATLGIGACVAVTVITWTAVAYFLLYLREEGRWR